MPLPRFPLLVFASFAASAAFAAPLTYTHDIAPIVAHYCAPCHSPGQSAPFSLLTYEDVQKRAQQIGTVTHSRYMPPWLPEHGYGDFANELRLSDEQIRTISDWVAQGAPRGEVDSETAPAAETALGQPDLVIQAEHAYTVPASGPDVYWNFVFRPNIGETRFVRAVQIDPGNPRVVHHANLLVDRMASTPEAGFPGMDLAIMRSPFDPDGNFLFWKPGSPPHVEPTGFSWRLDPGNELDRKSVV